MIEIGPRPLGFPTARKVVDGRHCRSFTGYVPTPKGGGLVPFESLLEAGLVEHMAEDSAITLIHAQPETFVWRDVDGSRRRYTPDFLAVTVGGAKIYREVKPYATLMRDPEFSGRRVRIELECAVRGATFEVWTEREIREDRDGVSVLRVATAAEADLHRSAPSLRREEIGQPDGVPGVVRQLVKKFSLWDLRRMGDTFAARSNATGILMIVLGGLAIDLETGMLVWSPAPRARELRGHRHDVQANR